MFKKFCLVVVLGLACAAWAQRAADDPDWKESEVPPPPAFDVSRLVTFETSPNSSLVFAVDPATLHINQVDGVLRYVMVATSATGVRNISYEGIRCVTGEFKTYARYSPSGQWNKVANPQWRSVFDPMPSQHALRFAKAGACDNSARASSVEAIVQQLKITSAQSQSLR
ncbi:CNP1-like family protein [Polaromonas sp.]|uniref:CNP1-like family protein n=1 Tax=Polaromonas sp. TaxID=1869339 RepID=UPI002FC68B99